MSYDPRSPYYSTEQESKYIDYLGFWNPVAIPPSSSDLLIQLDPKYNRRPDLLSNDLYGTPLLWWVFASRNPDVIKDPIYDFRPNVVIYAPAQDTIRTLY